MEIILGISIGDLQNCQRVMIIRIVYVCIAFIEVCCMNQRVVDRGCGSMTI